MIQNEEYPALNEVVMSNSILYDSIDLRLNKCEKFFLLDKKIPPFGMWLGSLPDNYSKSKLCLI